MGKLMDWLALPAYCGFIFFLSSQEKLPIPPIFDFQDKILHFGAYFLMGVFAWRAFRHTTHNRKLLAVTSVVFCGLYGISDEWHQSLVPGRDSSVWDWLADTSGAFLASIVCLKSSKIIANLVTKTN